MEQELKQSKTNWIQNWRYNQAKTDLISEKLK